MGGLNGVNGHHALLYLSCQMPPIEEHFGDVVNVKSNMPDGSYKIEPLRKVIAMGLLRPQFGDTRVFVFEDFDTMSEICQNSLLKFIEEPQEYNRFIMTAESTAAILPTILSRVVTVRSGGGITAIAPVVNEEAAAKADTIAAALLNSNEYDIAVAFCDIKDRQMMLSVLRSLLERLSGVMLDVPEPQNILNACDVVNKYISRMEYNPNMAVTAACCAAELYSAYSVNGANSIKK